MEIEQKERERIETKNPWFKSKNQFVDPTEEWTSWNDSAIQEHLHLQKEVIQPKDKRIQELEAEIKALRDGTVEFLTWMKKTQRLSIEAITAIDQLLLKNEG